MVKGDMSHVSNREAGDRDPSHRAGTKAARAAATRQALLDAGRVLFATLGYAGTPREEIVARAGVTRGALQHHFGDKQALFREVFELVESEVVEAVATAAMAAGADPLAELRAGCQAYLDAVLDPAVQRICAIDGPAVLPEDVRRAITDRYALGLVRGAVEGAIAIGQIEAVPVEALARVLLAAVTAAAQFVATAPDPDVAREEAGRTVDLLLTRLAR
jgi:AcrR family transcriptional regulator